MEFPDTIERALLFNEDEEVWRRLASNKLRQKSLPPKLQEIRDAIDWITAERETRRVRAIGFCAR